MRQAMILPQSGLLPVGQTVFGLPPLDIPAERILFWSIVLVPLWWILGIQIVVFPLVGWYLFIRSLRRPYQVPLLLGWNFWWLYIGAWSLSLLVNLVSGGAELGRSITTLGSIFGVWALIVILWSAMRRLGIRYQVVIRAVCVLGLCQLLAVVVGESYLKLTGSLLQTDSLLVTLFPALPRGFLKAQLYYLDQVGWDLDRVPRLISFYYWSPIAGTMSAFICAAALSERNRLWQVLALLGGLTTAWYAAARVGQVALVLGVIVAVLLMGGLGRKILLAGILPVALGAPRIIQALVSYFFEYRSDSGKLRNLLYERTYEAFLDSPLLGYGTHGRDEVLVLPLGSHSQIYSTLYQTGVLGTVILVLAWVILSFTIGRLALQFPEVAPVFGAWVGLTIVMFSGELEAASVTVFVLGAWLGCAWNRVDELRTQPVGQPRLEAPLPWEWVDRRRPIDIAGTKFNA
ncbi:O-antigen ligase family protein [Anthocerotibacter panamensis]|uniref:O-antigen ligase family protein n=1 Tax=Anthocerotibacter panamensis TaxID=2857077 RepID=UPI001C4023AD|nr:O-antigen ligase family protein [Anthocerotibacter panamensis]